MHVKLPLNLSEDKFSVNEVDISFKWHGEERFH